LSPTPRSAKMGRFEIGPEDIKVKIGRNKILKEPPFPGETHVMGQNNPENDTPAGIV